MSGMTKGSAGATAQAQPAPGPMPMPGTSVGVSSAGEVLSIEEAAAALRVLRHGGVDEATTKFALPPSVRATVSPLIAALRWAAVMFGLVFASTEASDGDLAVVVTLSIALYHTTWRTFRPLRLASERSLYRGLAITDGIIIGGAVGISAGFDSPFIFCVMAVASVGAFGWGLAMGSIVLAVATAAMAVLAIVTNAGFNLDSQDHVVVLGTMVLVVGLLSYARARLLDVEARRASLAGRLDMLAETNDLLHILNQVARTLPTSLDLREALGAARTQLARTFDATVVGLSTTDDEHEWIPQLTDGCALPALSTTDELPLRLQQAVQREEAILVPDLEGSGLNPQSGTGIYTALRTRGKVVGVLAVEHDTAGRYTDRELRIIDGLAEAMALTVDNARWFRRLRTLGAEEERTRIARDLHDRLGQWLTYISFELERIMGEGKDAPELTSLYGDVQTAIEELRETLRQLRSEVTEDRPLSRAGAELIDRIGARSDFEISFEVTNPAQALRVPIENEMLRILQEALNNIDKHAGATQVGVRYAVADGIGRLDIEDNGKGFDVNRAVRESAYGLVGMRERADAIGARLSIESAPGSGTSIAVLARNDGGDLE